MSRQGTRPLDGITVIDLTRVLAGPYCTLLLADMGARVIKVEHPDGGDDSRQVGPFIDGESAYFVSINRDKESIALDLKRKEDRRSFEALLEGADVLIENFRPGTMEKLGYEWEALHDRFPRLVYASVSGFGQTGPYSRLPAYDMVVQAMGGIMSITGHPGGAPTRVGMSIGDIGAGLYAALGVQAALLQRHRTGEGERVDIGMLDCQVALLENAVVRYHATGEVPGAYGSRHPSITPFDVFKTADGWIVIAAGNDTLFGKLCDAIGMPEARKDARFATVQARCEHHLALKSLMEELLGACPSAHWRERLSAAGIPNGPFNTVKDLVEDPQIRSRNMLMEIAISDERSLTVAGNPIKLGSLAPRSVARPAPKLDQDRDRILGELAARV